MSTISRYLRDESGKAESKVPSMILIAVLLSGAFWFYMAGINYWKDVQLKHELQELTKYDTFKIRIRPTNEERRELIAGVLRKHGVKLDDKSGREWLKVETAGKEDRFYSIDLKYKRDVMWPILGKKEMWFQYKLMPL